MYLEDIIVFLNISKEVGILHLLLENGKDLLSQSSPKAPTKSSNVYGRHAIK